MKRPGSAWLVGLLFGLAVSPGDLAIFTLMAQHHATPWVAFGLLGLFLCSLFAGLGVVGSGLGWANTRVVLRRKTNNYLNSGRLRPLTGHPSLAIQVL